MYQPATGYLLDPNNAYDKCFDGFPGYGPAIYLWDCPEGTTNHNWTVTLVCPPSTVKTYISGAHLPHVHHCS